ncbi:MAG: hypothetical protein K9L74_03445 [Candidatus Izimaplasma sp.]|nr:hypothetical protein [Candidatus Izimaplasma bacterium]
MNELEKSIKVNFLLDRYQSLLTDKQRAYLKDYFQNDYSITEISQNHEVSRNAVYDQIKRAVDRLNDYEKNLNLVEKYKKRIDIITQIKELNKDSKIENLLKELEGIE